MEAEYRNGRCTCIAAIGHGQARCIRPLVGLTQNLLPAWEFYLGNKKARVREHRQTVCSESRRYYRAVFDPPQKARVISVDEKPSIQALEQTTGYVETDNGKIVRSFKST